MQRGLLVAAGRVAPTIDAGAPQDWFHGGHEEIWAARERDIVALAGVQSGKTAVLPYWLLREIQNCAEFGIQMGYLNAIYAGPTLSLLQAQAIPAFRRLFEDTLRLGRFVNSGKPKFHFSPEGSRRLLGVALSVTVHFAYLNDSNNVESMTAACGVVDESGQDDCQPEAFNALLSRVSIARSTSPEYGRLLFGTTPYEHGAFKRQFVDSGMARVVNWPSWENPLQDRETIEALRVTMPEWKWRMRYLGTYERPAGQIYDCYNSKLNTCKRFNVPSAWRLFAGLDFGLKNVAGLILAEERLQISADEWGEPTGRYFVVKEYHAGESKTALEHQKAFLGRLDPKDVTAFGGNHQESDSRELWALSGLPIHEPPVTSTSQSVWTQIDYVYAGIKTRNLIFFDDLVGVLGEVENYALDIDEDGNPLETIKDKAKYHRLDALRYVCAHLFRRFARPAKPLNHHGQPSDHRFQTRRRVSADPD